MKLNVLSLCDGMSCGQLALAELGVEVANYYSCEIDKNAIKVTQDNFPNTHQLGDVLEFQTILESMSFFPKIDLVMFGFPCKSLSVATQGRSEYNSGLKGASGLFYSCLDILKTIQNKNSNVKFLVENVMPNKESDLKIINSLLGVEPIIINSSSFSAQERIRLYWTNIDIPLADIPIKKSEETLKDILDKEVAEKYYYDASFQFHGLDKRVCATLNINGHDILKRVYNKEFKSPTLTACRGGNTQKKVYDDTLKKCRKLTPNEYRKLQTIPHWCKMNVADSHIYNMCGDGWTVDVVCFIFKYLDKKKAIFG